MVGGGEKTETRNTHLNMPRPKRLNSEAIEKAKGRHANLVTVDPALDLGNNLTVANYLTAIEAAEALQNSYNQTLALADEQMSAFTLNEAALNALSERMLQGVSTRFGKDSEEYKTAGGTKRSERKRPVRKVRPAPAPALPLAAEAGGKTSSAAIRRRIAALLCGRKAGGCGAPFRRRPLWSRSLTRDPPRSAVESRHERHTALEALAGLFWLPSLSVSVFPPSRVGHGSKMPL